MQLRIAVACSPGFCRFFKLMLLIQAFLYHSVNYAVYFLLLFSTFSTIQYVCVELQKEKRFHVHFLVF
jgi:hypothetical protein